MSHADMNNCCGFNEAAASFSWNSPKKAINPYLDPAEVAPVSALSNLITLYAADNEQEQLRREALSDQVWERYFFNESRDPVQREMEQDKLISRAKLAHEQQRFNPDMVILADVNAQPSHISKPLMQRIEYFSSLGRPKAYSRYLRETIKPCLERLEHVRDSQLSTSFRFMASHEGLDGLLILPEMSQDQVKRLSTLVAAHMSMCLDAACGDLYATDDVKPEEIRKTWEKVAAETLRLDVIPPAFEQLRRKRNRRKPVPYELIPGSLARMLCADWWYRKLWKMRCEWREEQLRAVCLVSKKASPYVWTDGIGNTSGVIPGKTITERQAAEGLISNVLRVERALERCVKQPPPQKVYDAVVSFAFNVGTGNACSSTLVKLLNQRRWADACRQLPRWVYVKGVFNQGLDNRRAREMAWCLQGAN